jgi:hypothetical protein
LPQIPDSNDHFQARILAKLLGKSRSDPIVESQSH